MNKFKEWIDELTEQLCKWLNDFFPNNHALALAGYKISGTGKELILPVDRRRFPTVHQMSKQSRNNDDGSYVVKTGDFSKEQDCGFWAYCHMSGQPCVWCGGGNDIGARVWVTGPDGIKSSPYRGWCPKGKKMGAAWWGCCKGPVGNSLVGFRDCCGHGVCDYPWKICNNWPEAKNWCIAGAASGWNGGWLEGRIGATSYYCTIVETVPGAGC